MEQRENAPGWIRWCVAAVVVGGGASLGAAQNAGATIRYVDYQVGFELQVPAGWDYDRTGFFGPGGSLGLLRGGTLRGRETLQVFLFQGVRAKSLADWTQEFRASLETISGVMRIGGKGAQQRGAPAAYVVVDATVGVGLVKTVYYCVQLDDEQVWVLSYAKARTTLGDDSDAAAMRDAHTVTIPPEVERLVGSVRIFYDPPLAATLREALKRGRDFITRYDLQERIRKLEIDDLVRYYLMEVDRNPVGYFTRRFSRGRQSLDDPRFGSSGKDGLRVYEESWRFGENGAAQYAAFDLYSSIDGERDLFEISMADLPPEGVEHRRPFITVDKCVRADDVLFSSYTTSRDLVMPEPRPPLRLESAYLGLGWVRVLPALIGTDAGPLWAFSIYDTASRTALTYSMEPLGVKPLPRGGGNGPAYRVREGFNDTPGMLFTDEYGHMVWYEAGSMILREVDSDEIERLFAAKREAARPLISEK